MPGIDNCPHAGHCHCQCVDCNYTDNPGGQVHHCRQHPNACHLACNATQPATTSRPVA